MKKKLEVNYLGKKYLEHYEKITIKILFKRVEEKLKQELLKFELEGLELIKTKANYGGFRTWFKCSICKKKNFILYNINGEFICRKCSGLKYKQQRYKGMVEEKTSN